MCEERLPGLAVGFFDGVHRGHQAILAAADSVLTFVSHPLTVVAPARAPRLIMSPAEREAALRAGGRREVRMLEFSFELAQVEAREFAAQYLSGHHVYCGANWRFGRGGAGNAERLREWGFAVTTVPFAEYAGAAVSSTRIRAALEAGELEAATAMLGHPFALGGKVTSGKGEGRKLGFPTVNVRPDFLQLNLPRGVYAVRCEGRRAIANFGLAPTLGAAAWKEPMLEVHFPSEPPAALGPTLRVELDRFLRPERTFANLDELKAQIAADCRSVL